MAINGQPVPLTGNDKGRALLAYLACEPRWHYREQLGQMFWPDTAAPRTNLRQALLALRAAITPRGNGSTPLLIRRNEIRFDSDGLVHVDVAEFAAAPSAAAGDDRLAIARLEQQIELYRGEFLAGFALADCPEFTDWQQLQSESLRRHALALLERLIACRQRQGDAAELLLPAARRYAALDPWNEAGQQRLMQLLALAGQAPAASQQYASFTRVLREELGTHPDISTQTLHQQIKSGLFSNSPPPFWQHLNSSQPQASALPALAERRQVTVVYCELVTGADDPEEIALRLRAPQASAAACIRAHGGYISQAHGGGLLAYFGYPVAQENAARQALRAALEISRQARPDLPVRIGVHTGLIVTNGDSSQPDPAGLTSNIAIRLRELGGELGDELRNETANSQNTGHGRIVLSEVTQRLVSGYFHCLPLGTCRRSGMVTPLTAFCLQQETGAEHRLEAADKLTPMIGRQHELQQLQKCWQRIASGRQRPQVVVLQGEAGIGKSRLLHTLKQVLAEERPTLRELRCFPEFRDTPLHPLTSLLENLFAFREGDSPEQRRDKLGAYLQRHYPDLAEHARPLLGALLSLNESPAAAAAAQKNKEQTLALLKELLVRLSRRQPVLLLVEDLHWIDPTTLELLHLCLDGEQPLSILAILTTRPVTPEGAPCGYAASPEHQAIHLLMPPLGDQDIERLLAAQALDLPAAVKQDIIARADGIPLFAEEMALLAANGSDLPIPVSLQDLLAARLDSMDDAKRSAQLAASIGRQFNRELFQLLAASQGLPAQHQHTLQSAGLLLPDGPDALQFKHALIQEAAYQSQTRQDRQSNHRHIAETLQAGFAELADNAPEIVAQHWTAAGAARQAIDWWLKAGERAVQRFSHREAQAHLLAGWQLLEELPADPARARLETAFLIKLAHTEQTLAGYGQGRTMEWLARACALVEEGSGKSSELFNSLWGVWEGSASHSGHAEALNVAQRLLDIAEKESDPESRRALRQQAHYAFGCSAFWLGEFTQAQTYLSLSIALEAPDAKTFTRNCYGRIVQIAAKTYLTLALYLLGFPRQAESIKTAVVQQARQAGDSFMLTLVLGLTTLPARFQQQTAEVESQAREGHAIALQCQSKVFEAVHTMSLGWVAAMRGEPTAIAPIQHSLTLIRAIMKGAHVSPLLAQAEALMQLRHYEQALAAIDEALQAGAQSNDHHAEAELLRLRGECLLSLGKRTAAETCFGEGLAVSRRQGAKALELRIAMSLARSCGMDQDKRQQARRILQPVYAWFTEGQDTPDLQQAASLLADLAD